MTTRTGYRITIAAWLPVDPDDITSLRTAMDRIVALRAPNPTSELGVLRELSVKHRLVTRRAAAEDDPDFAEVDE